MNKDRFKDYLPTFDQNDPYTYIECPICNQKFGIISYKHMEKHGFYNTEDYKKATNLTNINSQSARDKRASSVSKNRKGKGVGVAGKYERTQEIKDKIAEGVSQFAKNGIHASKKKRLPKNNSQPLTPIYPGKRQLIYSSKMDREIMVRSSYEKRIMKYFDSNKRIDCFYYESLKIPYIYNNKVRNYIPDFYVRYDDCIKSIWEIKPQYFIDNDDQTKANLKALKEHCLERGYACYIINLEEIKFLEKHFKLK